MISLIESLTGLKKKPKHAWVHTGSMFPQGTFDPGNVPCQFPHRAADVVLWFVCCTNN